MVVLIKTAIFYGRNYNIIRAKYRKGLHHMIKCLCEMIREMN